MATLYDQDFVRWTKQQAQVLRDAAHAGWNAPIDWENIAEEIESLGKSDRRALASHISIRARGEIEKLLGDSPSLRREVGRMVATELPRARRLAGRGIEGNAERPLVDIDQITCTEEQVIGDWLPGDG